MKGQVSIWQEPAPVIFQEPFSFLSHPWHHPTLRESYMHTYVDPIDHTSNLHHTSHKLVPDD